MFWPILFPFWDKIRTFVELWIKSVRNLLKAGPGREPPGFLFYNSSNFFIAFAFSWSAIFIYGFIAL